MNHKKRLILSVTAICATAGAGTAFAAEHANLLPAGAPSGYLTINPQTCKFLHPEIDVRPGPSERYAQAEDSRHDVKLSCLTRKIDAVKAPAPDADGVAGYTQVTARIDFKQAAASVSCPAGDVVLGGGSDVEVSGSYPSSASTWTVTRDNMWGHFKTGSVYATCGKAAS